jgi:hypothetical protein
MQRTLSPTLAKNERSNLKVRSLILVLCAVCDFTRLTINLEARSIVVLVSSTDLSRCGVLFVTNFVNL